MEENNRINQNIILENRKNLNLTGVKDVVSFDDETVILDTALGRLTVKGDGLHISSFNTESGDLTAEGNVIALVYTTEEKSGGVFSRLFR